MTPDPNAIIPPVESGEIVTSEAAEAEMSYNETTPSWLDVEGQKIVGWAEEE
jgi:hypothetical protein